MKSYTVEEVAQHNTAQDLWVIIEGKVFDLTQFINEHPGGKKVLLKKAGKDASKEFKTFHNNAIMQRVGLPMQIGVIGAAAVEEKKTTPSPAPASAPVAPVKQQSVDIHQLITGEQARFGEGVPYGDPTWYQDWNRYKKHRSLLYIVLLNSYVLALTTRNPISNLEGKYAPLSIKKSCLSATNGVKPKPSLVPL
jgi:predicted heme/steroid binding protein